MYPRRLILQNRSLAHVFFRCHNKQFFLKDEDVKVFLLSLWAKYKHRYGIRIYDFIIMDNHAHLLLRTESAEQLGDFMRTVNAQLARFINRKFDRDSQAIRERYKSPLITGHRYLYQVMEYIWLNRYRVDKSRPDRDPFCSVCWRLNPEVTKKLAKGDSDITASLNSLLDPYETIDVETGRDVVKFVRDLLCEAMSKLAQLNTALLCSSHTIGDTSTVDYRAQLLAAFAREKPIFGV